MGCSSVVYTYLPRGLCCPTERFPWGQKPQDHPWVETAFFVLRRGELTGLFGSILTAFLFFSREQKTKPWTSPIKLLRYLLLCSGYDGEGALRFPPKGGHGSYKKNSRSS